MLIIIRSFLPNCLRAFRKHQQGRMIESSLDGILIFGEKLPCFALHWQKVSFSTSVSNRRPASPQVQGRGLKPSGGLQREEAAVAPM